MANSISIICSVSLLWLCVFSCADESDNSDLKKSGVLAEPSKVTTLDRDAALRPTLASATQASATQALATQASATQASATQASATQAGIAPQVVDRSSGQSTGSGHCSTSGSYKVALVGEDNAEAQVLRGIITGSSINSACKPNVQVEFIPLRTNDDAYRADPELFSSRLSEVVERIKSNNQIKAVLLNLNLQALTGPGACAQSSCRKGFSNKLKEALVILNDQENIKAVVIPAGPRDANLVFFLSLGERSALPSSKFILIVDSVNRVGSKKTFHFAESGYSSQTPDYLGCSSLWSSIGLSTRPCSVRDTICMNDDLERSSQMICRAYIGNSRWGNCGALVWKYDLGSGLKWIDELAADCVRNNVVEGTPTTQAGATLLWNLAQGNFETTVVRGSTVVVRRPPGISAGPSTQPSSATSRSRSGN
jgi:hypothetical protein